MSGIIGILLGDTLSFAAVGPIGPRRAGAVFALIAPMAALLGLAILGRPLSDAHRLEALAGTLPIRISLGLGAALGQATGSLIARPLKQGGMDPYL